MLSGLDFASAHGEVLPSATRLAPFTRTSADDETMAPAPCWPLQKADAIMLHRSPGRYSGGSDGGLAFAVPRSGPRQGLSVLITSRHFSTYLTCKVAISEAWQYREQGSSPYCSPILVTFHDHARTCPTFSRAMHSALDKSLSHCLAPRFGCCRGCQGQPKEEIVVKL